VVALSLADPPITAALRVILLGHARLRQTNEFGEWRVRSAGSARQRGRERRHSRAAVPVEGLLVNVAGGAVGRAARPQELIAGRDG
jgi:hypothetical protein